MNSKVFGYARVSTKEQNEDRQTMQLLEQDISERDIFIDKADGSNFNREKYQAMVNSLREGDIIIICSIDRLGRNYDAIIEQWRLITKELKCDIKVLDMPLLDTTKTNDLDGQFISDIVLQILSYVSNKEKQNLKKRQREGIEAKRKNNNGNLKGIYGRKRIEADEKVIEIFDDFIKGKIKTKQAVEESNLTKPTFFRRLKEYREKTLQMT